MSAGDIATILTALAGVVLAYTAYRKAAAESFVATGQEWRDLLREVKQRLGEMEKTLAEREQLIIQLTGQVKGLTVDNLKLDSQLGTLQQENRDLRGRVTTLESLNADLTFTIERLEREKAVLADRVETTELAVAVVSASNAADRANQLSASLALPED